MDILFPAAQKLSHDVHYVSLYVCFVDFNERPEIHSNTLFIARITDWEQHSNMARGYVPTLLFEPTCAYARWPHMRRILSVCDLAEIQTRQKVV